MAKSTKNPKITAKSTKVEALAKPAAKTVAKPKAVKKVAPKVASKVKATPAAKSKTKAVSKKVLAPKKPVATSKASKPAAPVKAGKASVPASKAAARNVGVKKLPAKPSVPKKASKASEPAPSPPENTKSSVIEPNAVKAAASRPSAKPKAKPLSTTKLKGVTMQDGRYALSTTTLIDLPTGYRPSSKEEYMSPQHLEYFRRKLQSWREDLVEESKQTIENLRDEVRDVGDEAERATRETENSLELRTRDRYRKLISKIDKALKRIEEGHYGFCEETDEDIGIDRLDARPIATLCLDAQERWEHRQKQMGD